MAKHAAFDILYGDYYARVFGLCRRLLNSRDLAEDATQEVFIRAYKNFSKYKAEQPFWQWIAAIANNHCVDLLRKQSRSQALFGDESEELHEAEAADPSALGELMAAEDVHALNQAIAGLDARYRVPLVLAYFHQASYDDIAASLAISRNHVGVLLLRGRQKLREQLATKGGRA